MNSERITLDIPNDLFLRYLESAVNRNIDVEDLILFAMREHIPSPAEDEGNQHLHSFEWHGAPIRCALGKDDEVLIRFTDLYSTGLLGAGVSTNTLNRHFPHSTRVVTRSRAHVRDGSGSRGPREVIHVPLLAAMKAVYSRVGGLEFNIAARKHFGLKEEE